MDINDRLEIQKELSESLNELFGEKAFFSFNEFQEMIEQKSSDFFIFLLLFILSKKPFYKETLELYKTYVKSPSTSYSLKLDEERLIASPNLKSKFSPKVYEHEFIDKSPEKKTKFANKRGSFIIDSLANKKINLAKGNENEIGKIDKTLKESENLEKLHSPVRKKKCLNLNQLNEYEDELSNISLFMLEDKLKTSVDLTERLESDSIDENTINFNHQDSVNIIYEGWIHKLNDNIMKPLWFKLCGKDLFCKYLNIFICKDFKYHTDEKHKGMHHLGGTFLIENPIFIYNNKEYYSFSMIYPQKVRQYFVEKEEEYLKWTSAILLATGNINLTAKYEFSDYLGKGKYGTVRLATHKKTNQSFAVKVIPKKYLSMEEMHLVKQEIEILKICQHENLIMLTDVFETNEEFYIFVNYCKGSDLFTWLANRKFKITESQAKFLTYQILLGVSYLHQHGIIHRDLKPKNILLMDDSDYPHLKLSDFGLSKIIGPNQSANESYGTLSYASPEVLQNKPYDFKADVWSIGIIIYLLLAGHLPFDGKTVKGIVEQTVYKETPYPYYLWKDKTKEAKSLVELCLVKNPNKRIEIKEALESSWFKK